MRRAGFTLVELIDRPVDNRDRADLRRPSPSPGTSGAYPLSGRLKSSPGT